MLILPTMWLQDSSDEIASQGWSSGCLAGLGAVGAALLRSADGDGATEGLGQSIVAIASLIAQVQEFGVTVHVGGPTSTIRLAADALGSWLIPCKISTFCDWRRAQWKDGATTSL